MGTLINTDREQDRDLNTAASSIDRQITADEPTATWEADEKAANGGKHEQVGVASLGGGHRKQGRSKRGRGRSRETKSSRSKAIGATRRQRRKTHGGLKPSSRSPPVGDKSSAW